MVTVAVTVAEQLRRIQEQAPQAPARRWQLDLYCEGPAICECEVNGVTLSCNYEEYCQPMKTCCSDVNTDFYGCITSSCECFEYDRRQLAEESLDGFKEQIDRELCRRKLGPDCQRA